jgi:hypothetical protein
MKVCQIFREELREDAQSESTAPDEAAHAASTARAQATASEEDTNFDRFQVVGHSNGGVFVGLCNDDAPDPPPSNITPGAGCFVTKCPACNQDLPIRVQYSGKQAVCQHCGAHFLAHDERVVAYPPPSSNISVLEWAEQLSSTTDPGVFDEFQLTPMGEDEDEGEKDSSQVIALEEVSEETVGPPTPSSWNEESQSAEDFGVDYGGSIDTHANISDKRVDPTMPPAEAEFVDSQWRGTFDLASKQGQTIRQKATITGLRSWLPVKSGYVRDNRDAPTEPLKSLGDLPI